MFQLPSVFPVLHKEAELESVKQYSLLIDHKYLLYRAFHATSHRLLGDPGVLLYAMRTLFYVLSEFPPKEVVVCSDSAPYAREELYFHYKSDRTHLEDEDQDIFDEASDNFLHCIRFLGIPFVKIASAEADDIIFKYVQTNPEKNWVILSSDSDLVEIHSYSDSVTQVYPKNFSQGGGYNILNKNTSLEQYPEFAGRFWLSKLLFALHSGHNGAPSISKLGVKKARALIASIPEEISTLERACEFLLQTGIIGSYPLRAYKEVIRLNLQLQTFPFPGLELNLPEMGWNPQPLSFIGAMKAANVNETISASLLRKIGVEVVEVEVVDNIAYFDHNLRGDL